MRANARSWRSLGAAVSARLVEETDAGRYHFTHALVRSTLEDALGPTRRLQLHRAAGLAVEAVHAGRLDAHLPQLAHHFAQAREVQKGIDYASRAGDRALTQLAPDEAMAYYRQALELLDAAEPAEEQRLGLLIALGEAQRQAGDPAHRETLLAASRLATERGDADALARAALANTRGFYPAAVGEVDDDRVASLQAALEATGDDDAPTRAACSPPSARSSSTPATWNGACAWPTRPWPSPAAPGTTPPWPTSCSRTTSRS